MSLVKDSATTLIPVFSLAIRVGCEVSEKFRRSAMLPGWGSVMSSVALMFEQDCGRIDRSGDESFTGINLGELLVLVKRRLGLLPNVCSVGRERLEGYSSMQISLEPRLCVRENGKSGSSMCFFPLALRPSGLVRHEPQSYTQNILTRRPDRKKVFSWTEQSQIPMISPSCIYMLNEMPQRFFRTCQIFNWFPAGKEEGKAADRWCESGALTYHPKACSLSTGVIIERNTQNRMGIKGCYPNAKFLLLFQQDIQVHGSLVHTQRLPFFSPETRASVIDST